jgi:hypothetical protein
MKPSTLAFLAAFALAGCSSVSVPPVPGPSVSLNGRTATAVDELLGSMPAPIPRNTTILVASVADLSDLTRSSDLGRLVAELAAEHLIQLGYRVPEVRLSDTLHVREGGEFILSRDLADIQRVHNAEVALTGTLTTVGGVAYVNLRLIRLVDGIALSASDFELPDRQSLANL